MRKIISICLVSSVACFVCLKSNQYFQILFEMLFPKNMVKVATAGEQIPFGKLKDSYWDYLELLVIGVMACIVSFTIGWRPHYIQREQTDRERRRETKRIKKRCLEIENRISRLEGNRNSIDDTSHSITSSGIKHVDEKSLSVEDSILHGCSDRAILTDCLTQNSLISKRLQEVEIKIEEIEGRLKSVEGSLDTVTYSSHRVVEANNATVKHWLVVSEGDCDSCGSASSVSTSPEKVYTRGKYSCTKSDYNGGNLETEVKQLYNSNEVNEGLLESQGLPTTMSYQGDAAPNLDSVMSSYCKGQRIEVNEHSVFKNVNENSLEIEECSIMIVPDHVSPTPDTAASSPSAGSRLEMMKKSGNREDSLSNDPKTSSTELTNSSNADTGVVLQQAKDESSSLEVMLCNHTNQQKPEQLPQLKKPETFTFKETDQLKRELYTKKIWSDDVDSLLPDATAIYNRIPGRPNEMLEIEKDCMGFDEVKHPDIVAFLDGGSSNPDSTRSVKSKIPESKIITHNLVTPYQEEEKMDRNTATCCEKIDKDTPQTSSPHRQSRADNAAVGRNRKKNQKRGNASQK